MSNFFTGTFMKRSITTLITSIAMVIVALATISISETRAQIFVTVGGGPGAAGPFWGQTIYPNPFMDYWWTIRSQYFLRASELTFHGMNPGQIVSMALRMRNAAPYTARNVTIKIRQTTNAGLTNPQSDAGMTTVFSSGAYQLPTIVNTPTWLTFPFSQPFQWDGVSNLHIEICTYRTGFAFIFPEYEYVQPVPIYATQSFFYSDGQNFCVTNPNATGYAIRPTLQFGVLAGI
jgi:hypothetical protein